MRVESGLVLVGDKGDLVCARFWAGEGGLGEGEEDKESLGETGELHDCFGC